MIITNTVGGVIFRWNARRGRVIPHNSISDVDLSVDNLDPTDYRLIVRSSYGDKEQPLVFKYSQVTSPVTATALDLVNLILAYNIGASNVQGYTAAAGQTIFPTSFNLGTSVQVFVNGSLQAPATYVYVLGGTTVTLAAPLVGGETVIIYSN